jgi:hypothetical protein
MAQVNPAKTLLENYVIELKSKNVILSAMNFQNSSKITNFKVFNISAYFPDHEAGEAHLLACPLGNLLRGII